MALDARHPNCFFFHRDYAVELTPPTPTDDEHYFFRGPYIVGPYTSGTLEAAILHINQSTSVGKLLTFRKAFCSP